MDKNWSRMTIIYLLHKSLFFFQQANKLQIKQDLNLWINE